MLADPDVNPWSPTGPRAFRGGPLVAQRVTAPLGRVLPYRRAAGEHPTSTGLADEVTRKGWSVSLGQAGLGDMLLGLGLVQALVDATNAEGMSYTGPRPDLMRRCLLPLTVAQTGGEHIVRGGAGAVEAFRAIPERPPTWLDLADDSHVYVSRRPADAVLPGDRTSSRHPPSW